MLTLKTLLAQNYVKTGHAHNPKPQAAIISSEL